ncbi:MAG: DNA mismatch repair protein MutT [Chelatococcus sp.]|nr:MAG: DNA mismatch repair protein MutT [Chelatococcus sp.]
MEPSQGGRGGPEAGLSRSQRVFVRALHIYFRAVRGMTLGVRAVVLNDRNEVFLLRHTYTPGWQFPGGGVETGETLTQAMIRELAEEALIVPTGPALLHGVFFNSRISRRDHVAVYVVRDFSVTGEKRPDREIAEARFFPLDALPEGITPGTRRRLDEIAGRAPVDEIW